VIQAVAGGLGAAVSSATGVGAGSSTAGGAGEATPFRGVFDSIVAQTSALDAQAAQAVTCLLSGQGVEIHEAMIATQKADLAFEMALQVRNKAVGAYQQMMSLQF